MIDSPAQQRYGLEDALTPNEMESIQQTINKLDLDTDKLDRLMNMVDLAGSANYVDNPITALQDIWESLTPNEVHTIFTTLNVMGLVPFSHMSVPANPNEDGKILIRSMEEFYPQIILDKEKQSVEILTQA